VRLIQKISFLLPAVFSVLLSCTPGDGEKNIKQDSVVVKKLTDSNAEWEKNIRKKETADSLLLDSLLKTVIETARLNKNKPSFQGQTDSGRNAYSTWQAGNLFSSNRKHLLVKRFIVATGMGPDLYTDIYTWTNDKFSKVISDTANVGYAEDTLLDVNGDGFKDYMVSSYSGTGCCPRDSRVAYLYDDRSGDFRTVGFFNPEFIFSEKIVYESGYGHPGEISIERYKWKGFEKVKTASVSPTLLNRPGQLVKPYTFTL